MFLRSHIKFVLFSLVLILNITPLYAQNVLDDFNEGTSFNSGYTENAPNLVPETVRVIAPSKKIFIITNDNKSFSKGDFISLLIGNKLVCRALVAKTNEDLLSGIKIVKIYDAALWKELRPGKDVLVLKGDDSYYTNRSKTPDANTEKAEDLKVQDEEDLFNSTILDEDIIDEENNRLIKTDNLLTAQVGMISAPDIENNTSRYAHFMASWGYQISDNVWAEMGVGTNTIADYPALGIDTRLVNLTGKLKYTFNAPFYSYIMPYVGYQVVNADSPGAGVDDGSGYSEDELQAQINAVEEAKKSTVIFGVTVLKRIVPGWFVRADLGSDIIAGGLTLEF